MAIYILTHILHHQRSGLAVAGARLVMQEQNGAIYHLDKDVDQESWLPLFAKCTRTQRRPGVERTHKVRV